MRQSAAELSTAAAAGTLAQRLSPRYLEEHCVLPFALTEAGVVVLAGQPLDPMVTDLLRCWVFERTVIVRDAPAAELHAAILSAHSDSPEVNVADVRGGDLVVLSDEEDTIDDLRSLANQAPVIRLVVSSS